MRLPANGLKESQLRIAVLAIGAGLVVGAAGAGGFGFADVVQRAKERAERPYEEPRAIPEALHQISYDQYQGIRFRTARSLWRASGTRFQVMLVPPGLFYTHPVTINVVDAAGVHRVPFRKDSFTYPSGAVERMVPDDLGYAGFKLTYPLDGPTLRNQFLVFAGASYFRGVGRGQAFGLSARGLAVDTGLPSGEKFPSFVEFWLVRPSPDAHAVVVYALLDGVSATGAYRFVVYPGRETTLRVRVVLFPRHPVALLGIAPLTSMFYYGSNTPRPPGEWRPQVHDSDGLLVHDHDTGEWLWRPLVDPLQLETDSFSVRRLGGFGLLQRQRRFREYQDPGARYDERPSAWVEPEGDWGEGAVTLVQLPTQDETNDNIVAFWTPKGDGHGERLELSYRLVFGGRGLTGETLGRAEQTFVGRGDVPGGGGVKGAYRLTVDFAGGPLSRLSPDAPVAAIVTPEQGGDVLEKHVERVPATGAWRLSVLARPGKDASLALRAFLRHRGDTLTETWTYRLPPDNSINRGR